jgi:autotransporter-associated beta strand protein
MKRSKTRHIVPSRRRLPALGKNVLPAFGLALALTPMAHAATENWTGATDGTWGTGSNWSSPSVTPDSTYDLTIAGPGDVAGTALNINIAAAAAANSINFTNTAATTLTNTTSGANQTLTLSSSGTAITTGTGAVTIGSASANQNVNVALGASQTWNVGSGGLTVTNVVSGTGFGITKSGAGTLTLQGANTYTGATQINAGTVSFKAANALNSFRTSTTIASGATLQWDATGIGGQAAGDGMGAAVGSSGANTTISGAGTLLITGNSTDYLGLGNTNGRTVTFSLGSGSSINIQGGTLRNGGWSGGVWTNNKAGLNIASGAAFDIWDGNTVFVDALTGSGNVVNASNSALKRTLTVGVDNGSGTFSGVIGGGARAGINQINLTKNGSGTQILTGTNTYVGATTISAGTLKVNGSIAASSGVTINGSGATLAGTGTVSGITLTSGTITPGDGGIGTLTASSLVWAAGNTLVFDLNSVNSTADLLSLSGALTKSGSGTYAFDFSGGLAGQTYTLINFGSNSGFSVGDFSVNSGISGTFGLSGTSLTFTAVPEAHEFAVAIVALLGVMIFIRRRNQQI